MNYTPRRATIGDGIFRYDVIGDNYVTITRYEGVDGPLTFRDGVCHIHIPETIDGLPVLRIKPLTLDLKLWFAPGGDNYSHNGSSRVVIHAPEYTAFWGLDRTRIDNYSAFTPAHSLQYYDRTQQLLTHFDDGVAYLARPLEDGSCAILFMTTGYTNTQDNVWDPIPRHTKLAIRVPEVIAGRRVTAILEGASLGLYPEIPTSVHIPDSVVRVDEGNFNGLPYLSEAHLGRGLTSPLKDVFNFFEEEDEERLTKVPPLKVYHHADYAAGETEFDRRALAIEYEDYADWGYMPVDRHTVRYPVEFIKLD